MIKELQNPEHKTYWIAYSDDKKVVHYGITETNQVTTTGLDNFEFDTDKQKLMERITELGLDILPEYSILY